MQIEGLIRDSVVLSEASEVVGVVQGAVNVTPGVDVTISGAVQGAVNVSDQATVRVTGQVQGAINLEPGSLVVVEGLMSGAVHNLGTVRLLAGSTYAAQTIGAGTLDVDPAARIVEPRVAADGSYHYDV